jgi:hypothetical protein
MRTELAHVVNDEGAIAGSLEPGVDLVVARLSIEQLPECQARNTARCLSSCKRRCPFVILRPALSFSIAAAFHV